ncbi:MAG: hypothetical protein IJB30_02990 [Clostridia bacterium]|nr:hypothetical protein [Clostridia bacterium]
MKNTRIKESLDKLNPSRDTREALLRRILMQEQAACEKEENMNDANKRQRKSTFGIRKLAPLMAAVIVIGALLCIPSVSEAVASWMGRMFRIDDYIGTMPEDREHLPEVDALMQNPDEEQQKNAVYLLSETDELELFNEARDEYGFERYDPEDWQWLKEIDPRVEDVLFENGIIYVTSSIKADASLFFFEGQDGIKLDWIGDTAIAKSGDTEIELYASSYGIQPQPGYYVDGEISEEALKQHERVLLLTEYEILRKDNTLPEGQYTFIQRSRILDCNVDVMANIATVAVVEQTFPFDTAKQGEIKEIAGDSVRFSGEYPLTRWIWERDEHPYYYNENIDLSDVSVAADCRLYTTGITIGLNYSLPESWDENKARNFIFGAAFRVGMGYELFVDGVSLGVYNVSGGPNNEPQIEIPLPESVRKEASVALLRPVYGYATELLTKYGELIGSLDEPQKPIGDNGGYSCDFTFEFVTMEGCDIYIPLN